MKYELSDEGNVERFIDRCGDCLRFCPEANTWLEKNDDGQWRHTFSSMFRQTSEVYHDLEREVKQEPGNEALEKWMLHSGMIAAHHTMRRLAKKDPRLYISLEDFKALDVDYRLIEWRVNARLKRLAKKDTL